MEKEKVIIVGAQGHAKVIIDIFEKENKYEIVGLLSKENDNNTSILNYKIIGVNEDLPRLIAHYPGVKFFIAIGDNYIRNIVVNKLLAIVPNLVFASTIHPSAQIGKNVKIGKGVAIMAGAIINSDTTIGDFAIVNTKASLDHDCVLGNYASLAPNATTGGNVTIGDFSAISISATIIHGLTVGQHTVLGAGAVLLHSCGHNQILYGTPAKIIRTRSIGESYL